VGFEDLAVVLLKIPVFWAMMLYAGEVVLAF
jgi:hypothetical protein